MSVAAGTRFGPYETVGLPGARGMGDVYEAVGAPAEEPHTFRKMRRRYSIHTGTKQTAVKPTE